jgi:hypothetical protein
MSFVGRPKPRTVGMDPAETAAAEPRTEHAAQPPPSRRADEQRADEQNPDLGIAPRLQ